MKVLNMFSCVEIHNKQDKTEYSTHIILKCIQDLKTEVYT